jgi:hypothetical protein
VRTWLVLPLIFCGACSNGGIRSGSVPEAADFLPTVGDSIELDDQPRLVLRCEAGRLGAYLVVGAPQEVDSGQIDERAVVVRLDSAPAC